MSAPDPLSWAGPEWENGKKTGNTVFRCDRCGEHLVVKGEHGYGAPPNTRCPRCAEARRVMGTTAQGFPRPFDLPAYVEAVVAQAMKKHEDDYCHERRDED